MKRNQKAALDREMQQAIAELIGTDKVEPVPGVFVDGRQAYWFTDFVRGRVAREQ